MSVITELRIPPDDFELGQILSLEEASGIKLETLVPSGDRTVPLFWVYEPVGEGFLDTVSRYPTVNSVTEIDVFDDRILFRLDWDASQDHLFQCILDHDGQILSATGAPGGGGTSNSGFPTTTPCHSVGAVVRIRTSPWSSSGCTTRRIREPAPGTA